MESNFPGKKFSTNTSAFATSRWTISKPFGFLKFTVIERLFLFTARKYADSEGRWDDTFGAFSDNGAPGGLHDPVCP